MRRAASASSRPRRRRCAERSLRQCRACPSCRHRQAQRMHERQVPMQRAEYKSRMKYALSWRQRIEASCEPLLRADLHPIGAPPALRRHAAIGSVACARVAMRPAESSRRPAVASAPSRSAEERAPLRYRLRERRAVGTGKYRPARQVKQRRDRVQRGSQTLHEKKLRALCKLYVRMYFAYGYILRVVLQEKRTSGQGVSRNGQGVKDKAKQ